jgi:WD40 repeat protein/transcriptional regulator with XRE-family HTH domain
MDQELPFGRMVRERRRAFDLTQDELSNRVGCAAITLRKIEAGVARPSQQIAERLAVALAMPPGERGSFVRHARGVRVDPAADDTPQTTPIPTPALEVGAEDLSGRAIRNYLLGERLGIGSFGAVYRAIQPLIERPVAVKIILPQYADHPDFVRRFEHEARIVAHLEHPHIVPLYDYWREPGVAYLVMRLLSGSLQARLSREPFELTKALRLVEQLVAALAAAHRAGIVHRDLKPANILLDSEANAYLADFGIAKDLARGDEDSTHAGVFVGSPAYSSPEQIRAEPITPQTDIYALGMLLFELLTGRRPFSGASHAELIQHHLTGSIPPLASMRAGLPPALDALIQRATAKVPSARYPDVQTLLVELRAAIGGTSEPQLVAHTLPAAAPATVELELVDADTPYVGLRAFGEGDAAGFFGREALQQQLLARLGESGELSRFLAVVGPSGSGKSSVVRAGLIPALRAGALPGSEQWFIVDLLPGADPFAALAVALWKIAPSGVEVDDLRALLKADARGLLRAVRLVLPADRATELVLVIDQFEELFTLTDDEEERSALLDRIVTAVLDERSRLRVVVTLRADFIDRPLQYVDFGELVKRRSELVLPLTPDELERAILGPAARIGVGLEQGLTTALVSAVEGRPGALPLLQHALSELFLRRSGRVLTRAAYSEIGGVAGALAGSAESCYAALEDQQHELTRQLFLRLITIGEGVEDTRRRVPRSELVGLGAEADIEAVLVIFGRARLLSFDHDTASREPTVEVAHEALLRAWPRLEGWVEGAREEVLVQRRLALAVAEWAVAGNEPSYLATGGRLAQFTALGAGGSVRLTTGEQAYVEASQAAADAAAATERERQARELTQAQALAEEQRQRAEAAQLAQAAAEQAATAQQGAARRLRSLVVALALFFLVAAGLSAFAFQQRGEAQANLTRSEAQRLAAEANRVIAIDGNSEVAALLALRSINRVYTPQGDAAIEAAVRTTLPTKIITPDGGPLAAVAYTPDGSRIILGLQDGMIHIWDVASSRIIGSIRAHEREVYKLYVTSDGSQVLSTGTDLVARLWDLASQSLVHEFAQGATLLGAAAVAPDGSTIMANSETGVREWDRRSGALLRTLPAGADVLSLAISPDSRYLAAGGLDGRLVLWDRVSGEAMMTYAAFDAGVEDIAFTPDGRRLLATGDLEMRLYERDSGALLRTMRGHTGAIPELALSLEGTRVATASWDGTARLWDLGSGAQLLQLAGHTGLVMGVAYAPDGRSLVTAGYDRAARIWPLAPGGDLSRTIEVGSVGSLAVAPDGRSFATGGAETRIWSYPDGALLRTLPYKANALAYAPDGAFLVIAGADGVLRRWDVGQEVERWATPFPFINSVAVSPDASRILIGGLPDNSAVLIDAATGTELSRLRGQTKLVGAVAFAPDGSFLVIGSDDGGTRMWSADGKEMRASLTGHTDRLWWLAVTPDSTRIVTASFDQTLRVWDVQSGRELRRLVGHTDAVVGVAISPDGRYILSGSLDRTARLWDLATGQELRRYVGHTGTIGLAGAIAFTPDGQNVLTASTDGTVRLWDVALADTVAALCDRLQRDFTPEERAQYAIPDDGPTCP